MEKSQTSKPAENQSDRDALDRLDADLRAFEIERRKPSSLPIIGAEAGAGYRVLGQLLSGILGGVGLGWLLDHFAHTRPWGVVVGVLGGAALSIWSTVRMAGRTAPPAVTRATKGPAPGPRDDLQARDDDES